MAYNNYKTVYVENSFAAGVAVGSLRAQLAGQHAGELNIITNRDDKIEVEIATYNPLIMSYAENMLAAYV